MQKPENAMYWDNRDNKSVSVFSRFKKNDLFLSIFSFIFPTKIGNEYFIRAALKNRGINRLLDIACGSGKAILPRCANHVIGIDIDGFPMDNALSIGYKEVYTYNSPTYDINLAQKVDAITIINLNAHINFDSFYKIMSNGLSNLVDNGSIVFINEYDNDSLSYRLLKTNPAKFKKMVANMQHDFLTYEDKFLDKLHHEFPNIQLISRKPIYTIIPMLHFFAYEKNFSGKTNFFERTPNTLIFSVFLLIDALLGTLSSIGLLFSGSFNRAFIVGYHYKYQKT